MHIGILSYARRRTLRSTWMPKNEKLLVNAAKARGHVATVFRADKCQHYYADGETSVLYHGRKFPHVDILLSRPSFTPNIELSLTLNEHFLLMGVPLVNGYMPVLRAKNKIRTLQILSHQNIPVPKTVVLRRLDYLDDAIKKVGGFPVILKRPIGSFGKGVAIVESRRSLLSSLEILWMHSDNHYLLIQEYVEEAQGRDVRVFVVGGKVVAAMERQAAEGDFRSNLHRGGGGHRVELTEREIEVAIDSTNALQLEIAGVDILRTQKGPVVMEVNSNPGLEGITKVTGIDVAGAIIEYMEGKIYEPLLIELNATGGLVTT